MAKQNISSGNESIVGKIIRVIGEIIEEHAESRRKKEESKNNGK